MNSSYIKECCISEQESSLFLSTIINRSEKNIKICFKKEKILVHRRHSKMRSSPYNDHKLVQLYI